jgi:hypothetical protein
LSSIPLLLERNLTGLALDVLQHLLRERGHGLGGEALKILGGELAHARHHAATQHGDPLADVPLSTRCRPMLLTLVRHR